MSKQVDSPMEQIYKWVVNDYFTPNIKAEVILDTLLTPCITQIIKEQLDESGEPVGNLTFLTKEMSILEEGSPNNRGAKIDYVLADQNKVYLVELKTTDSSIDDHQANHYLKNCQGKVFNDVLGERLCSILEESFLNKKNKKKASTSEAGTSEASTPEKLWEAIWDKRARYAPAGSAREVPKKVSKYKYKEKARWLIQTKGWTQRKRLRSRKYLYTLGQLLDCSDQTFWTKPMEVLYLTPHGSGSNDFKCLSLKRFADSHADSSDPYVKLLVDILESIYGENGNV